MKLRSLNSVWLLLFLVVVAVFIGCEGSDGPAGAVGDEGERGNPGSDWTIEPPLDRIFGLAVFNGRTDAHNGNATLLLTSDTTSDLDGHTVIMTRVNRAPVIDGIDDGDDVWGDYLANLELDRTGLRDNYIFSADMRAAYDEDYVYFMVRWTEVANGSASVGENDEWRTWSYDGDDWSRNSAYDDRVSFLWLIKGAFEDVVDWNTDGCRIACHANQTQGMFTLTDTTKIDSWVWGSVISNPIGFAIDAQIGVQLPGDVTGFRQDVGERIYLENVYTTEDPDTVRPAFQHKEDPNSNASYPMWSWEITGFDISDRDWAAGASVPGIVTNYPSSSAADILAKGHYDNGTWTVELRRVRVTDNSDDVEF